MTMKENILIVEDEFIVGNDLRLMLIKAGYAVCGIAASVDEAKAMIERNKPSWVLLDIFLLDGSLGTDLAGYLQQKNIGFIYISANTNQSILEIARATRPYGFLVKPFREKDLLIMLDIARYKHQNNLQMALQREQFMQKQLQQIIDAPFEPADKIARIPDVLQTFVPFDHLHIAITGKRPNTMEDLSFQRTGYDEYEHLDNVELCKSLGLERNAILPERIAQLQNETGGYLNDADFRRWVTDTTWKRKLSDHLRLNARLAIAVTLSAGNKAVVSFYSRNADTYTEEQFTLLARMENGIRQLLEQVQQKHDALNTRIVARKRVEKPVADNDILFEGIVGRSPAFLSVLHSINMVSTAPSSVLILGESGTGKELIARCIHRQSPRKNKPLVTVNCAALPAELIESELFGHEKGAFTGATDKRAGKFEIADGGTIFLDEIGELPVESQVKLLRVLQEKEFERVGGNKIIKVDVRVIAATNRNLEKEVAEGRFRLDLYYRLNVFPVELPSLRERKDDIPLLAKHFVDKLSEKLSRNVTDISPDALKALRSYDWPGNIREMEHVMERSLLMTTGTVLKQIMLPKVVAAQPAGSAISSTDGTRIKTLEEMEIEHILQVLKSCKGKVCGIGGAAEMLGLPPSTLNSKIRKLGIKRDFHFRD